jgi:hypothetical protein
VAAVAVADRVLDGGVGVLEVHHQVPGQLGGPGRGRVRGGAEDTHASGGVFDGGEDVQPAAGESPGFEEVGGEDRVRLGAQERGPGQAAAAGYGIDAGVLEDLPDGRSGHLDAEGGKFAADPAVAPVGVLFCQAGDQVVDAAHGGRAARPFRADAFACRWCRRSRWRRRAVSGETIRCSCRSVGLGSRCRRAARNPGRRSVTRSIDLALQDGELVAQREDLDVLVHDARRQQAHEGEHVGQRQVGQSQEHDRSSWCTRYAGLQQDPKPQATAHGWHFRHLQPGTPMRRSPGQGSSRPSWRTTPIRE